MRATNNEKRTLQPVTALTNFAASTILDTRCGGSEPSEGGSEPAQPPQLPPSEGLNSDSERAGPCQLSKSGLRGGCEPLASETHNVAQLPTSTLTGGV